MGKDQILADLRAAGVPSLARLGQPDPGPDQQRLDRGDRDAERSGYVGIGHAAELSHQQGRALLIGQPLNVGDQPPQRVTLLDPRERILTGRGQRPDRFGRGGVRAAQLIDAAVVSDPIEPCAQRQLTRIGAQTGVGADEDFLNGVLSILGRACQHLARVRKQPLPVAIVDDPERVLVAGSEQRHELLVGPDAQERSAERDPCPCEAYRCWEGGGFHLNPNPL
jgi:hypothetical protein